LSVVAGDYFVPPLPRIPPMQFARRIPAFRLGEGQWTPG